MNTNLTTTTTKPATSAIRRMARQPGFVAAVIILAAAAAGLNASVGYMKLHFKKQPVPMARPLATMPADLGVWQQVSMDEALDPEVEHALGTNEYIFRDYMDTRVVGSETIAEIRRMNERVLDARTPEEIKRLKTERATLIGRTRMAHPTGVVNLAVTYYTGLVDTVAHVPDRCYVADGYEPKTWEEVNWNIDDGRPVEVRYINFEDGTGRSSATRSVAYFFHVNGGFQSSPNAVRLALQNLFERYGYYAKVEVMTLINDKDTSAKVMEDFLTAAMPEIRKSLPDWEAVTRDGVPPAPAGAVPNTNAPQQ
ncbi:MAG TPA: exosortase-associated EpsI family protein [Tepidisphaeraceae bacterium]|nr:exosortase-associated EpsI family protein [Tepidisphaeraceae bacterium]